MAEEDQEQRTEQPTAQRIRRAFEEGQIGFSSELLGGLIFATGVVFFLLAGSWFFAQITRSFRDRESIFEIAISDPMAIRNVLLHDLQRFGWAALSLLVPVFFVTAIVGGLQTNFNISFKPLELDWSKLSPVKGFGRIFSSRSVVKVLMATFKASMVCLIAYGFAQSKFHEVLNSGTHSYQYMIVMMAEILLYLLISTAAMITIFGVADFGYQKWKHLQDLRMSLRDIRDEQKESEGDPQTRARLRRLRTEMSRQRIAEAVSKANVIVTNPTHFAVALEYDMKTMLAPKVTAKGADHLAQRIKELAKEHGVPVVERKPVARFLYFNVKVEQSIPAELYAAVAEILNFVGRFEK